MSLDLKQYPILFVDDEAPIRKTLPYAIEDRFTVLTAPSGEQALKVLGRRPVSILLTDQRMPGMSGVELCRRAKELQPDLVTMLITAYADLKEAIAAINRGQVSAYIEKPWDDDELTGVLETSIHAIHSVRTARDLGIQMLRAGPEYVKLTVLEQIAHEVLHPVFVSRIHHQEMIPAVEKALGMLDGAEMPALRDLFSKVLEHQRGSFTALEIIKDIAARHRPRGRPVPVEVCDVVEVVENVVRFARPEIERSCKVEVIIKASPTVRMERSALARIILNLLLNAAQAMADKADGKVMVEVDALGKTVILRVRDNGPGIAPENINRVLEPYFTTRSDGSGLGLTIVRDLVEQADGTVRAMSPPRQGATFEVRLPLAMPETPADE